MKAISRRIAALEASHRQRHGDLSLVSDADLEVLGALLETHEGDLPELPIELVRQIQALPTIQWGDDLVIPEGATILADCYSLEEVAEYRRELKV